MTPRKILVPFDFSQGSAVALKYACDLGKRFPRAQIVILHVLETLTPWRSLTLKGLGIAQSREWVQKVEKKLDAIGRRTKSSKKLPVRTIVRQGRPAQEIVDVASRLRAELIVMGNVGYDSLHFSLLGTTAERVVREAPCPVLLVGVSKKRRAG